MASSTLTSREFNQDTSKAKKAAKDGPVFITDRGRPAHVLMTVEEYRKVTRTEGNILDLLAMPEGADLDFEFPKLDIRLRPIDFEDEHTEKDSRELVSHVLDRS
jgi:prevent-host-death family protein